MDDAASSDAGGADPDVASGDVAADTPDVPPHASDVSERDAAVFSDVGVGPAYCADGVWDPDPDASTIGDRVRARVTDAGGLLCLPGLRLTVPPSPGRPTADIWIETAPADSERLASAIPRFRPASPVYRVVEVVRDEPILGDDERVVVEAGSFDRGYHADAEFGLWLHSGAGDWQTSGDRGERVAVYRYEGRAPAELVAGYVRAGPRCGDGVVESGEDCEPSIHGSACSASCEAADGFACDDVRCAPRCVIGGCLGADVGPCAQAACDKQFGVCTRIPIREGQLCDPTGLTEGWCREGLCVDEPPECGRCPRASLDEPWQRWLGGACWPEEWHTYDPSPRERVTEGCDAPWRTRCADSLSDRWLGEHANLPVGPDGVGRDVRGLSLAMRYRHRAEEFAPDSPPPTERYALTGVGEEASEPTPVPLEPGWPDAFADLVVPIGELPVELELLQVPDEVERSWVSPGLQISAMKASETNSPYCEVAVRTDEGLALCPTVPGRRACDESARCVDLFAGPQTCGDCDTVCASGAYCEDGACQSCPLAVRQYNPALCDGSCPPGSAGLFCDQRCPGDMGDGELCSGRGDCDDGLYGSAACACDEGYHGIACELSCADGEVNGEETAIDCGGPCGPCAWEAGG